MRKIFLAFIFIFFVIFSFDNDVNASDVQLTINIPEQYISRVQEYVDNELRNQVECIGLNAKQCLEKAMRIEYVGKVRLYEDRRDSELAIQENDNIELQ